MLHCNLLPAAANNALAPLAFVARRQNISNFNTAHFYIQYCTLFHQYCTKCAILHTKIGPGVSFGLSRFGKYQYFKL